VSACRRVGVGEWWSIGVLEWWSDGGVVEWWSIGVVEWWSGGVVEWWRAFGGWLCGAKMRAIGDGSSPPKPKAMFSARHTVRRRQDSLAPGLAPGFTLG
jgi:hypothetical protein